MKFFILTVTILFYTLPNIASELRMTKSQALAQGYKLQAATYAHRTNDIDKHSLPWPVSFIDSKHTIGNSMPEYQNYANEAYYHGGADLRVSQGADLIAPIEGFLQGNYYSYVTDPDTGQDQKYIKPISAGGDELYFELSIKTLDGTLFEFHHVDAKKLPKNIYEMILRGGGPIQRGELIGSTILWPTSRLGGRYDHIHYNMISPAGVRLNPEYYSSELVDTAIPVIKNIFAIYKNKKVEVLNQKLNGIPEEIIILSTDMKGENIYPLPPVFVEASWSENKKVGWDFTQFLLNSSQSFPDIREVFARNLKLSDGRNFTTRGDYNNTQFLFRLKIPPTVTSPIKLTVKDISGNENSTQLNIIP